MILLIIQVIHWLFGLYTLMIAVRIIGSWFPNFARHQIMRFLRFYTDPYLNLYRRLIPPIGALDLTPILAFLGLQMLEKVLIYMIA